MNKLFPIVLALLFFGCDENKNEISWALTIKIDKDNMKQSIAATKEQNICYYTDDNDKCGVLDHSREMVLWGRNKNIMKKNKSIRVLGGKLNYYIVERCNFKGDCEVDDKIRQVKYK